MFKKNAPAAKTSKPSTKEIFSNLFAHLVAGSTYEMDNLKVEIEGIRTSAAFKAVIDGKNILEGDMPSVDDGTLDVNWDYSHEKCVITTAGCRMKFNLGGAAKVSDNKHERHNSRYERINLDEAAELREKSRLWDEFIAQKDDDSKDESSGE